MCGKCCMGMGRYVKITGMMGPLRYAAVHELSKETFYPVVMRQYRDIFLPSESKKHPEWCPFLIEGGSQSEYFCAVHDTAPLFCRRFRCCIFRIFNSDKSPAGEVKGKTTLVSSDSGLKKIWDDEVMSYPADNLSIWKRNMISVLQSKGYSVCEYD